MPKTSLQGFIQEESLPDTQNTSIGLSQNGGVAGPSASFGFYVLLTLSKDNALGKKLISKWAELNILTIWWLSLLFLVTSLHKVF